MFQVLKLEDPELAWLLRACRLGDLYLDLVYSTVDFPVWPITVHIPRHASKYLLSAGRILAFRPETITTLASA